MYAYIALCSFIDCCDILFGGMGLFSKVSGWVSGVGRDLGLATMQAVIDIAGDCLCGMGPYADGNPESALETVSAGVGEGVISAQPVAYSVSALQEEGLQKHQVCEGQYSQAPLCSSASVCLVAARVGAWSMMKVSGASLDGGRSVAGHLAHVIINSWSRGGAGVWRIRSRCNRGGRVGYGGPSAPGGGWPPDLCFL